MNYKIEAINILLNEDCILTRYYPLIPYKEKLLVFAKENNIKTKDECMRSDMLFIFESDSLSELFKRFLVMYDNEDKLKFLNKLTMDNDRFLAYSELFLLPGVKETRAELYYLSGYKSLSDIANSSLEEILNKMERIIRDKKTDAKLPLNKEVKTHIAVAKAFTM